MEEADFTPATTTTTVKRGGYADLELVVETTDDELAEATETYTVRVEITHRGGTFVHDAVQTITDNDEGPVTSPPAPAPVPPAESETPQVFSEYDWWNGTDKPPVKISERCEMAPRYGINNWSGTWGAYLSGCTASVVCPITRCLATAYSRIAPQTDYRQRFTLNARMYAQSAYTNALFYNSNKSCDSRSRCLLTDAKVLDRNDRASSVCNGVREINPMVRAVVECMVKLEPYSPPLH